jgi:hypothetical protein
MRLRTAIAHTSYSKSVHGNLELLSVLKEAKMLVDLLQKKLCKN